MAPLNCSYLQISVDHVRRASSLLNKSIVRIEQPDIALDDDNDDIDDATLTAMADAAAAAASIDSPQTQSMDTDGGDDDENREPTPASTQQIHKKLSIPYEKYKTMSDMLVTHIRAREELTETEGIKKTNDDDVLVFR